MVNKLGVKSTVCLFYLVLNKVLMLLTLFPSIKAPITSHNIARGISPNQAIILSANRAPQSVVGVLLQRVRPCEDCFTGPNRQQGRINLFHSVA